MDVARGALAEAAKSLDPDLRYRALYNLGLVGLLAAQADTTARDELLDDAADRLRQALLLQPSSARAKWNLELAERRRPPPPPQGGGGGGGRLRRAGDAASNRARHRPSQGLTQSQAEQILNSMDRRERETRAEQQRRLQNGSAGGSEGLVIALLAVLAAARRAPGPSGPQLEATRGQGSGRGRGGAHLHGAGREPLAGADAGDHRAVHRTRDRRAEREDRAGIRRRPDPHHDARDSAARGETRPLAARSGAGGAGPGHGRGGGHRGGRLRQPRPRPRRR